MNEQMQALCFMAGANSIFYGCKLLTTPNPKETSDQILFEKLETTSGSVPTVRTAKLSGILL